MPKSVEGVIDLFSKQRLKILLYLASHPEGRQKSEIAADIAISRNESLALQKAMYREGLIAQIPNFKKHLFTLSEKGSQFMRLVQEAAGIVLAPLAQNPPEKATVKGK